MDGPWLFKNGLTLLCKPVKKGSAFKHLRKLLLYSFDYLLNTKPLNQVSSSDSIGDEGAPQIKILLFCFTIEIPLSFQEESCNLLYFFQRKKIKLRFFEISWGDHLILWLCLNSRWIAYKCGRHFQIFRRNIADSSLHIVGYPFDKIAAVYDKICMVNLPCWDQNEGY